MAARFPAVLLTGAGQIGKTSLVRKTFPGFNYVSLDLSAKAELAEKNPEERKINQSPFSLFR